MTGPVGEAWEERHREKAEDPGNGRDEGSREAKLLSGDGDDLGRQEERHAVDGDLDTEVDQREIPDADVPQ